ncbi:FmdB family zinc ribbon protein [Chloroflexota bacterium]
MPIYEYECSGCSSRFELKQSFSDDSRVSCPQCGGNTRRIFSPATIIYKGSGFYITDNKGNHNSSSYEGNTDEAKAGSTNEAKAGNTDEAKAGNTDKAKAGITNEAKADSTEKES